MSQASLVSLGLALSQKVGQTLSIRDCGIIIDGDKVVMGVEVIQRRVELRSHLL